MAPPEPLRTTAPRRWFVALKHRSLGTPQINQSIPLTGALKQRTKNGRPQSPAVSRHLLAALVLAALWIAGPSAAAAARKKDEKANQQKALMKIAEYVLKNGVDKGIKAPLSRALGYDLDIVETRALRQTKDISSDKREHGFYVVFTSDKKGRKAVKEIVLANILLTEREKKRYIEGVNVRIDSDGKPVAIVQVTGFEGEVQQERLNPQSERAKSQFKDELSYQLNHIDFFKPSK